MYCVGCTAFHLKRTLMRAMFPEKKRWGFSLTLKAACAV